MPPAAPTRRAVLAARASGQQKEREIELLAPFVAKDSRSSPSLRRSVSFIPNQLCARIAFSVGLCAEVFFARKFLRLATGRFHLPVAKRPRPVRRAPPAAQAAFI